ncbi:MAG: hypothetical protein JSV09_16095 [Thermoplasmata archaeon]|nr:MAG: hypothetical protein JSV09_16095 [Thermoplasmata archaeon]
MKFRMVVIAANCLLASLSLINLYTIAAGAVDVEIPEEEDFAWSIDTRYDEANFFANFTVTNNGLYDIADLDIHAIVRSEAGTMLIDYSQKDLTIPSGHERKFNIIAVLPFDRIDMDEWRNLMFNDSVFFLDVDITASYLWGLGRFVVDDTLEYPWEAPAKKIGNKTGGYVIELLKYVVSENADLDGFMDMVADEVGNNVILGRFDWNDASLRMESWPLGDNTSRMVVTVTMDVLSGRRQVTFEIIFIMKLEDDGYDVKFEDYRFDYR